MPLTFDRRAFFDAARTPIFRNLSDMQVSGCESILAEAERRQITDVRPLAYILATAFWESGRTMQPVREIGMGHGHAYGLPDPQTHQIYYGRGLVQLTWKSNYEKMAGICLADLVNNPDLALRLDIATQIIFEGMERGLFTGKKLADYFTPTLTDWVGARRIINGTDQASLIAGFAQQFSVALKTAARTAPAAASVAAAPPSPPAAAPKSFVSRLRSLLGMPA